MKATEKFSSALASTFVVSTAPSPSGRTRPQIRKMPGDDAVAWLLEKAEDRPQVQREQVDPGYGDIIAAARVGISGPGASLPHFDQIQRSFGRHDVSGVVAHTDGVATMGTRAMGAVAFMMGNHISFAGGASLRTTAHEAAHAVQQRENLQLMDGAIQQRSGHLKNGVGKAGDVHERHADAVADRVAKGESAEPLLDQYAVARGEATAAVGAAAPSVQCQTAGGDGANANASDDADIDVTALALTPDEQRLLQDEVQAGQVSLGAGSTHLTGNEESDTRLLGERLFFLVMQRHPIAPFDSFSIFPGIVQGVPLFEAFRSKVIQPAYASLPLALKKSLADRAAIAGAIDTGALDVGPRNTQGFRQVSEQLTGPPPPAPARGSAQAGAVTPELRSAIARLSAHASARHAEAVARGEKPGADTAIVSLLRPPVPGKKKQSLHSEGSAVDLSVYAGKHLDIDHPDEALDGVLALIADLPPGFYAMGLPREPRTADFERLPQFFEHPELESPAEPEPSKRGARASGRNKLEFRPGVKVNTPPGATIDADIAGLRRPETQRLMGAAVVAAKTRGVVIVHIFPDAVDHVHLSTGGPGFGKDSL